MMKLSLPQTAAIFATFAATSSAFVIPTTSSTASKTSMDLYKVFIDGEAGTTGLQVRGRLEKREDLEIISPPDELRKDAETRKKFINEADAVILCLPDAASIEAASWVEDDNDRTVLIDASTAFRVADDWTYGFPEMSKDQREALSKSKRISNPGCYPTGFIGLTRPLVEAGILAEGTPLTVNAISGYSGGGKALMEIYEAGGAEPWGAYGFGLTHKHIPEMAKYSKLNRKPIFQPQVATFVQGMVVSVPLHYAWLHGDDVKAADLHAALTEYYKDASAFIEVVPLGESGCKDAGLLERGAFLRPDTLADTNKMQLFVFANDEQEQAVLCARLDNLGKGASGAAVQNLNIALGLDETTGL
uniref:Semialdehyde dehydrogenase NAD-binding domain-containing protein n=1 Tax=Craspedostauros australis TaxID=1486917 RepID=A0A7R9WUA6_9STRA|eukprot:CAMPEP_0198113046 /NCGR_PEP_ID=MMETSP1442-20131203/4800_1 /TAXON_ID= /ORGANISM="Craspedostauros australis, Strain CCMP3328" /LENGTH=359 /DNA_ID=CAMNT_0043770027 /DNA_START=95 /DNA_END=1174 /DNA_ORIENTATION=-